MNSPSANACVSGYSRAQREVVGLILDGTRLLLATTLRHACRHGVHLQVVNVVHIGNDSCNRNGLGNSRIQKRSRMTNLDGTTLLFAIRLRHACQIMVYLQVVGLMN